MSIEFLKTIRKTERDCEEKIKKAEAAKERAIMDAEKEGVLQIRDAGINANEIASKILSDVKTRIEKEFVSLDKEFETIKSKLDEKAKKSEKKAVDLILSEIL